MNFAAIKVTVRSVTWVSNFKSQVLPLPRGTIKNKSECA